MDDDGTFPNNPDHPLVLYKYAWKGRQEREARRMIENSQKWTSPWAWGVFPYHHYHSKAWELLVCVRGEANVQLGGEKGPTVLVETGDVVFVPPGFAHKQLDDRNGFTLLGSYPTEGPTRAVPRRSSLLVGSTTSSSGPPRRFLLRREVLLVPQLIPSRVLRHRNNAIPLPNAPCQKILCVGLKSCSSTFHYVDGGNDSSIISFDCSFIGIRKKANATTC